MWSGSIATIPAGWALCDGTGGTPDFRDKFVAAASVDVGGIARSSVTGILLQTGGTVTHNHSLGAGVPIPLAAPQIFSSDTSFTPHIPPFYALAFIMKL